MRDPYTVLGVSRTASEEEIKKAFRALAKKHHPDATGAKDAAAMKRFQEITAAYDLLSDAQKRRAFDRGEIDANGQPRVYGGFEGAGGAQAARDFGWNFGTQPDDDRRRFEDLFGDIFGGAFRGRGGKGRGTKGADVAYSVTVTLEEAAHGAAKRVTLPSGKRIDLKVPAGVREGQQIRLRGQGEPGKGGGEAGDALFEVIVTPHSYFRREGNDIHLDLPITLGEAVTGAKIEVPTLSGLVAMTVPANTSSGTVFRLKGRGIAGPEGAGDQYVRVMIALPEQADPNLAAFVKRWAAGAPYDPRRRLFGA